MNKFFYLMALMMMLTMMVVSAEEVSTINFYYYNGGGGVIDYIPTAYDNDDGTAMTSYGTISGTGTLYAEITFSAGRPITEGANLSILPYCIDGVEDISPMSDCTETVPVPCSGRLYFYNYSGGYYGDLTWDYNSADQNNVYNMFNLASTFFNENGDFLVRFEPTFPVMAITGCSVQPVVGIYEFSLVVPDVACVENWQQDGVCNGVIEDFIMTYSDWNNCGTFNDLPVDNGTLIDCCAEEWVTQSVSECLGGNQTTTYVDTNVCGTVYNTPFGYSFPDNCVSNEQSVFECVDSCVMPPVVAGNNPLGVGGTVDGVTGEPVLVSQSVIGDSGAGTGAFARFWSNLWDWLVFWR